MTAPIADVVKELRSDSLTAAASGHEYIADLLTSIANRIEPLLSEVGCVPAALTPRTPQDAGLGLSDEECWELCSRLSEITPMPFQPNCEDVTRVVNQWLAERSGG